MINLGSKYCSLRNEIQSKPILRINITKSCPVGVKALVSREIVLKISWNMNERLLKCDWSLDYFWITKVSPVQYDCPAIFANDLVFDRV